MEVNEAVSILNEQFKGRDWFVSAVAKDKKPFGVIVFTRWQNGDILKEIPDTIGGYQVMVHFHYDNLTKFKPAQVSSPLQTVSPVAESVAPKECNVNQLIRELDQLEKICGSNTLQDIFYEIHDGKNAVTDMSSRYPEVRVPLEKLYQSFGFDVIYEELDG